MSEKKLLSFHSGVVKDINEQLVLKLIQEHDIISSSELVKITGMRPSTIFNILKELSAKSFISFYGKGDSTKKGGKKPYIWNLNHQAAYAVGLDIEVGEISAVVLDFCGTKIYKKRIKFNNTHNADELVKVITKVVNNVISENPNIKDNILGLGIAFAGIVNKQTGIVAMSSVIPEIDYPLLHKLDQFSFPILIENNANSAAIGLNWKNKNKLEKNCITIAVEIDQNVSGLGIGIIINGELYRGASFCAGELYPHMPTLKEILQNYRSRFSESELLKNYINNIDEIDIQFLLEAAKAGDKIAQLVFSIIGNIVGQTIYPAVALLNPDALIITGIVSELENLIVDSIRKEIEMRVISLTNKALSIRVDQNYQYSVAIGAASLILEEFFKVQVVR